MRHDVDRKENGKTPLRGCLNERLTVTNGAGVKSVFTPCGVDRITITAQGFQQAGID